MKWKENLNILSQDLEPFFHDCGQFYFCNVKKFRERNGQVSEGFVPIYLSEFEVQDIDNEMDWKLAELKYSLMNNN